MKKIAVAAVLVGIAAIVYRCGRRRSFASLPLAISGAQSSSANGVARRGTWMWPGERVRWTLPAGPAVRVRLGFHSPLGWTGGSAERLVVRVAPAGTAEPRTLGRPKIAASSSGAAPWSEKAFDVPRSREARVLEVALEGSGADPRPLFLADAVAEWPRPAGDAARRIVVLFLVDTLRADHLSLYGYGRPTTPEIDGAFRSALVAERCYANATWTLPSHASIFTSTTVNRHGVRSRTGALPANFPLLAESLAAEGFSTLAVTGGGFVDASYGFARGFDRYLSSAEPIESQIETALRLIDESPSSSVFLFFHTYQVHDYAPSDRSARELFGSTAPLGAQWQKPISDQIHFLKKTELFIPSAINRYDAALRRVDDAFAAFERGLDRRKLWDDAAIVLTSDHGEELFDHPSRTEPGLGYWGHPLPTMYDGELRVPLLVRAPGRRWSGRLARGVSLLDVGPTILDIAGIRPPATFEGTSVGSAGGEERFLLAESPPYDAVAVRRGADKVVTRPGYRQPMWGGVRLHEAMPDRECFALDKDPGERDGEGCRAPWVPGLMAARDRYVAESFPDSVVLRLSGDPQSPCRALAGGAGSAPSVRTFAAPPTVRIESAEEVDAASLTLGPAPLWLAFRPTAADRAIAIDLKGCGGLRTAAGSPVAGQISSGWSGLLWRGTDPLPAGNVVVSVAPMLEPSGATQRAMSPELLTRLRSLGYLTGGAESGAPAPVRAANPPARISPPPAGQIRIRIL